MTDLWNDHFCDGTYLIPYELSKRRQEIFRDRRQKQAVTEALETAKKHLEETTNIRLIPVDEFLRKTGLKDAFRKG